VYGGTTLALEFGPHYLALNGGQGGLFGGGLIHLRRLLLLGCDGYTSAEGQDGHGHHPNDQLLSVYRALVQ
jgi:hypothetical protein